VARIEYGKMMLRSTVNPVTFSELKKVLSTRENGHLKLYPGNKTANMKGKNWWPVHN